MKPYVDFFSTMQTKLIGGRKFCNEMKRYWGTTTTTHPIEGTVEVFKENFKLWPINENNEELVYARTQIYKWFNIDGDLIKNSSKDGIEGIYLQLKYRKDVDYTMYADDVFATAIEYAFPLGQKFTVTITYTDPTAPTRFSGWTDEQVLTWFEDEAEPFGVKINSADINANDMARFLLTEPDDAFETSIDSYTTRISNTTDPNGAAYSGVTLTFSFTRITFLNNNSPIIESIKTYNTSYSSNILRNLRLGYYKNAGNTSQRFINNIFGALLGLAGSTDPYIWCNGLLRVSAGFGERTSEHPRLSYQDFSTVFGRSIDTYIDEEDAEWWEVLIAVVIAIIVFSITGDPFSSMQAFAYAAGVTALVLTVLSLVAQQAGMYGLSKAFGNVAHIVGIAAMVAGIASFISNISNIVSEYGWDTAMDVIMNGTTEVTMDASVSSSVASAAEQIGSAQVIGSSVQGSIYTFTVVNPVSVGGVATIGSKVAGYTIKMRTDMQADKLSNMKDRITDQQNEIAALMDTELNIGAEDLIWSTKPFTIDSMIYSVDHLYEGTKYNIGRPSFYTGFAMNQLVVYDPDPYQLTARTPQVSQS